MHEFSSIIVTLEHSESGKRIVTFSVDPHNENRLVPDALTEVFVPRNGGKPPSKGILLSYDPVQKLVATRFDNNGNTAFKDVRVEHLLMVNSDLALHIPGQQEDAPAPAEETAGPTPAEASSLMQRLYKLFRGA